MDFNTYEIKNIVRSTYSKIAKSKGAACGCGSSRGCNSGGAESSEDELVDEIAIQLGYQSEEIYLVPDGANMGLGCGNPHVIASLKEGEVALDLGSGAGFDCFLASRKVGKEGKVIGIDMTTEMIMKARESAFNGNYTNVDFRLGEIESLPVANDSIDVIMSNCVINLSPEKQRVFEEAFRVLKPGGRIAISDVIATNELPVEFKEDPTFYAGCVSGAATVEQLTQMLTIAGFNNVKIEVDEKSSDFIKDWAPGTNIENYVASGTISAAKS